MAIQHSMTTAERRQILLRARKDVETTMFELAFGMGLDADAMDFTQPDVLWQTDVEGVSLIDDFPEADKKPYENLKKLSENFINIVGKLEGPNRVV